MTYTYLCAVRQASSRAVRLAGVLLVVFSLYVLAACTPAVAAAVSVSAVSGGTTTPTWRIGDVVPLTVYVRLARQVRADRWTFGGRGDVEDDVVEPHELDGFADAKEAAEAQKKEQLGAMEDLDADIDGLTELEHELSHGKHRYQYMRGLPPRFGPRFAVQREALVKLRGWLSVAAKQMRNDTASGVAPLQSELALRVSLGRGLKKETTWLPVLIRREKLAQMDPSVAAQSPRTRETLRVEARRSTEVMVLDQLTFDFGYQTGVTHTLTSYAVHAVYSSAGHLDKYINGDGSGAPSGAESLPLRLVYVWHQHSAYNPTRAMTLCSGVALIGTLVMVLLTFNSRAKASKQFRRRAVAMKRNEEDGRR